MNKLNRVKFTSILLLPLVLAFAGCSEMPGTVSDGTPNDKVSIDINAKVSKTDDKGNVSYYEVEGKKSGSASRSIIPTMDDDETIAGYTFKLSGSSAMESFGPVILEFTDKKSSYALSYERWDLTLAAYKTADAENPVFIGYQSADLRNGSDSAIAFLLKDSGLVPGSVTISGSCKDPSKVAKKLSASLYDLATGEKKSDFAGGTLTGDGVDKTFSFTKLENVPTGSYQLKIKFFNDSDDELGTYTDAVIVAGFESKKTDISVLLNKLPDGVDSLSAYYIYGSEDPSDDTYKVVVQWDDDDTSTEFYRMKIVEYDDSDVATVVVQDGDREKQSFASSPYYNAGDSLLFGNKNVVLTLSTGKRYDVELESVNTIGSSGFKKRTKVESVSDINISIGGVSKKTRLYLASEDGTDTDKMINLVRMAYYLGDGTWVDTTEDANESYEKGSTVYKYDVFEGAPISLVDPDANDNITVETKSDADDFYKWVDTEGNEATETDDYHNIWVKATYDAPKTDITYTYQKYENDLASVTIKYGKTTSPTDMTGTIAFTSDEATKKIDENTKFFQISAKPANYKNYIYYINGEIKNSGTSSSYVFELKDMIIGTNYIAVVAKDELGNWYGKQLVLTITR